jgi:hypothetical protein
MNFEKIPGTWFILSGVVFLAGFVVSLLAASRGFTVGFVAGGLLVLVNSWVSARSLKRVGFFHKGATMASVVGGFYVRLILLGVCLYGLFKLIGINPVGLVAGLSVVPAGLLVMLLLIYVANRRPREV